MDIGLTLLISTMIVMHVVLAMRSNGVVSNQGSLRLSGTFTVCATFTAAIAMVLPSLLPLKPELMIGSAILLGLSLIMLGLAANTMFSCLRITQADEPPEATMSAVRAVRRTQDPRDESYKKLYWSKKREVGRLQQRIEELEEMIGDGEDLQEEARENPV